MSRTNPADRPGLGRLVPWALAVALSVTLSGVGPSSGPVAADDDPPAPALVAPPEVAPTDPAPTDPALSQAGTSDSAPGPGPLTDPQTGPQTSGQSRPEQGSAKAHAGPTQSGGGSLPGEKPTGDGTDGASDYTDAAPPIDPNFVDDYARVWKQVQRGKLKVRSLGEDLIAARQVLSSTFSDLALALRVRNRADFELSGASGQLDLAVRDMYITGTTDVDVILGVLGSKPDDVLRNIDAVVYLRSATGHESADLDFAESAAVVAQSAAASALIRADQDRARVDTVRKALAKTKKELRKHQKELQRLVSVAAPQTVVGANGCPKEVLAGTVPEGIDIKQLCGIAVRTAASPQAAFAIKWALVRLGAPYACEGIGRLEPWRYDCSSFVSRAYAEGAGLGTAGRGWAPSTRNMVPWDGASLDPHYAVIQPKQLHPGDLVLYDTCPPGEVCPYRHVVMYLGPMEKGGVPMMVHTNSCGDVAHVSPFTGTEVDNLLGVRRVVPLAGERIIGRLDPPKAHAKDGKPRGR